MATSFVLDTNVYCIFFQADPPPFFGPLRSKVDEDGAASFYISEITSLEIHSVLGKYRRGSPAQQQECSRLTIVDGKHEKCEQTWLSEGRRGLSGRRYRDLQKMATDIESGRGDLRATILKLDKDAVAAGTNLLRNYADKYNLGSHDALIAGTLIAAIKSGMGLTMITRDKGLKASLADEGLPYWDPGL